MRCNKERPGCPRDFPANPARPVREMGIIPVALRNANATPGPNYFFPYCSFEEMKSPAMIEKMKRGPVGFVTLLPPGPPAMGRNLVQWFIYCVVISLFAAYLSSSVLAPARSLPPTAPVVTLMTHPL